MKYWNNNPNTNRFTAKSAQSRKISLKSVKHNQLGSQVTEQSTTCNSMKKSTNKRSIKDLLEITKYSAVNEENLLSMSYNDIRCVTIEKQSGFL
jgi:hypothetical protein